MSEFDFTPIVCLVSLIVLTLYILRQVKVFHEAPTKQRIDQRLSDREMELTGQSAFLPARQNGEGLERWPQ